MKKRFVSTLLSLAMLLSMVNVVYAGDSLPKVGSVVHGFKVVECGEQKLFDAQTVLFEHEKTGGSFLLIQNSDTNRAFDIAFRTPSYDTGVSHVFEHISLGGSEKYPADVFFNVANQTFNTYMNAYTSMCHTAYPIASKSDEQLLKLADYYLDGVFYPLMDGDTAFRREAWRYTMETPDSPLEINGTVYNEMRGNLNASTDAYINTIRTAFPNSNRAAFSGGDPDVIPRLTNEDIKRYHDEYYRPSNALITLYGKTDYDSYLSLADEYFSKFDDKEADLSDNDYEPVSGHIEKTFNIHGGENSTNYIYYAIPCVTENDDDLNALIMACEMLDAPTSDFQQYMQTIFPSATFRIGMDLELTEPLVIIGAQGLGADDGERFKNEADKIISATVYKGISEEIVDVYAAQMIRAFALPAENSAIDIIQSVNSYWAATGNINSYFRYVDFITDLKDKANNKEFERVIRKYLVNPKNSVMTINIPDVNLTAQKDAELLQQLAEKKAAMSEEEINEIVRSTQEYKNTDNSGNDEIMSKINVSTVEMLRKDAENYKKQDYKIDEENLNSARIMTSEVDAEDIGMARLYIDISQLTTEQLLYFQLYRSLMANLPTEKYSRQEIMNKVSRYISGNDKILPADDALYYTIQWTPLNGDTEQTYDTLYEMLFNAKLDNLITPMIISAAIDSMLPAFESSISYSPDSLVSQRISAQNNEKAAYYSYMEGLDFYEFLKDIKTELETAPQNVIGNLVQVRDIINNSYNAVLIYAGNKEGVKLNKKYAKGFMSKLNNLPHSGPEHEIPRPQGNEGIIVPADVNYNAIYAPLDWVGADRNGALYVTQNIISDKFLLPAIRGTGGAYGAMTMLNEYGIGFISYRDPNMRSTIEFYNSLGQLVQDTDITQEEVDRYIMSAYSTHAVSDIPLSGAYDAMRQSVYNTERDTYEFLGEILSATPEDVKSYANIYKELAEKGIISAAGKSSDINANRELFDTILNPFGTDRITIILNGKRVKTDTDPIIANDRTLVPMRAVFEEMGCTVEWNGEGRSVTVTREGIEVVVSVDSDIMTVNGTEIVLDAEPQIVNERTMVPLRAISEALRCGVEWNSEDRSVEITSAA